jgi:hypothetical protein
MDYEGILAAIPADTEDAIDRLTREYAEWNKAQGLNLGSADEHLMDARLTSEQREWLMHFCARWEDAEQLDWLATECNGAVLYWQLSPARERAFQDLLARNQITYDEETDCYMHLDARKLDDGSYTMRDE